MEFKTQIAELMLKGWKRGLYNRGDVQVEYFHACMRYMTDHKQEDLDVAKELLYMLNEIIQ